MNVYQNVILSKAKLSVNDSGASIRLEDGRIILKQNENAYIETYSVVLESPTINSIKVADKEVVKKFNSFEFTLDFANKVKEIYITFVDGIADPAILKVDYIESSKEAWDEKMRIENQKVLTEKANVKVNTGDSIINVTFQPVNDSFSYSKVELYLANIKSGVGPITYDYQLMAKYKTPEDVYFHSIPGLAYGTYAIVLVEYDANNKELYKSDFIEVKLSKPNYSGKPTVTARWL